MPIYIHNWQPFNGRVTLFGNTDAFDPNYYAGQSRDNGFETGDLLRLDGDGLSITMTAWNAGIAFEPDWALGPKPRVTFVGMEQVYGSDGDDLFRAGKVTEALDGWRGVSFFGGGGNDDVIASRFDDFVDPGDGDDLIKMGAGNDHVDASRGDDTVYGGAGSDNIRWGGGDSSWLAPGDDFLSGGDGYDTANLWAHYGGEDGSRGTEVSIYAVRADGAMTGTGTVQVDEAGNTDTVRFIGFEHGWTHQGNDTIDASGAEISGDMGILWGARWGDDVMIGSGGNDTLEGGDGADTLTGGGGNDLIVTGGEWYNPDAPGDGYADTIIFSEGDGNDTVSGWDTGIDQLVLHTSLETFSTEVVEDGLLVTLGEESILLVGAEEATISIEDPLS